MIHRVLIACFLRSQLVTRSWHPSGMVHDWETYPAMSSLTSELTFQGESSPGRHKFKCRFRVEKPLHMRVRSLGQFCLAPPQPSQPPFFAQPGHETDRRSVAEDPQPIGGVTADFADERRFKESPGYLPHHRRHHGSLPYRAWRIDLGTPRLEYKRLVDSKNHLRQPASSAVDLQPKGKIQ